MTATPATMDGPGPLGKGPPPVRRRVLGRGNREYRAPRMSPLRRVPPGGAEPADRGPRPPGGHAPRRAVTKPLGPSWRATTLHRPWRSPRRGLSAIRAPATPLNPLGVEAHCVAVRGSGVAPARRRRTRSKIRNGHMGTNWKQNKGRTRRPGRLVCGPGDEGAAGRCRRVAQASTRGTAPRRASPRRGPSIGLAGFTACLPVRPRRVAAGGGRWTWGDASRRAPGSATARQRAQRGQQATQRQQGHHHAHRDHEQPVRHAPSRQRRQGRG